MATSVYPIQGGPAVRRVAREGGSFSEIADAVSRDAEVAASLRRRAGWVLGSRATADRIECCIQTAWVRTLRTARRRCDSVRCGLPALDALLGYLVRSVDLVGRELWDPARDPDCERAAVMLDSEDGAHDSVDVGSSRAGDPFSEAARAEDRRRLVAALHVLSPDARRVIVLRYLAEMSGEEVGLIEGQSPPALRARLYRAMSQLRAVAPEALRESELGRAA